MTLSAFDLDRRDTLVRTCLKDPYQMHRMVMTGFPDVPQQDARRALSVLYRLQPNDRHIRLYVLSGDQPDWSHLSPGFQSVGEPKDLSDMEASFILGGHYVFDLLANPCKKVVREGKNSNRVFLSSRDDRAAWLARKAADNGFKIVWVREEGQLRSVARPGGDDVIEQTGVYFRGELLVTDAERFREGFRAGIGPGKAFGFGMLMLFPWKGG